MNAPASVLVVGGGLAGFHTANALRRAGHGGALTVIGSEPHPAYDRPPLSKAYLSGAIGMADLVLDDPEDPLDAEWVRGTCAIELDPYARTVHTADGRAFTADAIVIATGSDAVRLGPEIPGTHVLRTLDDAEALRSDGVAGRRVAVVGGGFVALEAASTAIGLGAASVTVISPEAYPLCGRLGPEVALSLKALHERHGVRFVDEARAAGFVEGPSGRVSGVTLADGRLVEADLVVVGVGARPATGWLASSGMPLGVSGAILCDSAGRTGADGVWAVGDCAQLSAYGRAGHWQDALDDAAAVAASILGQEQPPAPVPYCWSEQYGTRLQVVGEPGDADRATIREGSIADGDLLVAYERDGEEVGLLGMNRLREVTRWRRSRMRRRPVPQPVPVAESQPGILLEKESVA